MAVVRFPEGQQRSGSVGGAVYSHNRYGAYIRARSVPVNPNTARQVAARNLTRNLSIAWQVELTQAERDVWDAVADVIDWVNALGDSVTLTGLNWYIRTNTARMQGSLPRVDDASGVLALAQAETALVVTGSAATQQLSVAFDDGKSWVNDDDAGQLVHMGIGQSPARKFFGGPWRYAGVILGDSVTPPTSPQTLVAPYPLVDGQRIWMKTRITLADGRLSQFAQAQFLGAA